MEDIEEEMSSQYEKSSQRQRGNRSEVEDDFADGVTRARKVDGRTNGQARGAPGREPAGREEIDRHQDNGEDARNKDFPSGLPHHPNPIMSELAEIEESLASSSQAMSARAK